MRRCFLVSTMLLFDVFAQAQQPSSAYKKVVKVMHKQLNYTYDLTSDKLREPKPDTVADDHNPTGIRESFPVIDNPSPVVVLDGAPVPMEELNSYKLKDIENIEVLRGRRATAIYGSRAKEGAVLITTKKK